MNKILNFTIQNDTEIDLLRASLNISQYIEYPDLDIECYISKVLGMIEDVGNMLPIVPCSLDIIQTVNNYLFKEKGYRGNKENYYEPCNSFLNDVLDNRTGIPITLCILYSYIANRLGLDSHGVCFPGHFILRSDNTDGEYLIDPFNEGRILTREDCQSILDNLFDGKIIFEERFIEYADNHQILKRVINNLKNIYITNKDYKSALKTVNLMLMLDPEEIEQLRDRALICINLECYSQSLKDLENYFSKARSDIHDDELRSYIPVLKNIVKNIN